jgi:hypothetical protein
MTDLELEEEYCFCLSPITTIDYKVASKVLEWLKTNMESITDSKNVKLFSKVNYGYNEGTLKGFGKKPVCDVYINDISLSTDMTINQPSEVNSFVICYLKGNMNNTYAKACELTDYLIQEFMTNESFRTCKLIYETTIEDIKINIIPQGKTYGVLCAFELKHKIKR